MLVDHQVSLRPAKGSLADSSFSTGTTFESQSTDAAPEARTQPQHHHHHHLHHQHHMTPHQHTPEHHHHSTPSLGSSPHGSSTTPRHNHNRMLFSDCMDPEVLFADLSRHRVLVDELNSFVRLLQADHTKIRSEAEELRGALLTARSTGLPKAEMGAFRENLTLLQHEQERSASEVLRLTAENAALGAENGRFREAFQSKTALLAARASALQKKELEADRLAAENVSLEESLRREVEMRAAAEENSRAHAASILTTQSKGNAVAEVADDMTQRCTQLEAEMRNLYNENADLRSRLAGFTEAAVRRTTFDSFDAYREEMEAEHLRRTKELEHQIEELVEDLRRCRATTTTTTEPSPNVSAILPDEEASETSVWKKRAYATISQFQKSGLFHNEALSRAEIEGAWEVLTERLHGTLQRELEVSVLLTGHERAYSALGTIIKRKQRLYRAQMQQQVKPLLDDAYRQGHTEGAKARRKQRRRQAGVGAVGGDDTQHTRSGTTSDLSDENFATPGSGERRRGGGGGGGGGGGRASSPSGAGTPQFPQMSQEERLQLFEEVIRTSPAEKIAPLLLSQGLRVTALASTNGSA